MSTTWMTAGTASSEAPDALACSSMAVRSASFCVVKSTMRSPLRWSGIETATDMACGHDLAAMASTADNETISPAILAKRLARPLIAMKPAASMVTMSPVSCQPPGKGSNTPGFSTRR